MPAIIFNATDAKGRVDWLVKTLKVPMDELSVKIGYSGKNADRDVNEKFLAGKSRDLNDRYAKLVRYCDDKAKASGVQYTAATVAPAAALASEPSPATPASPFETPPPSSSPPPGSSAETAMAVATDGASSLPPQHQHQQQQQQVVPQAALQEDLGHKQAGKGDVPSPTTATIHSSSSSSSSSNSAPCGGGGNGDDGEADQAGEKGQSLPLPLPTASAETSSVTTATATTTTTATAAATVAGYIYMNVLGTMEHHTRRNDGTVDAAAAEEVKSEGPDGPLVVLKVGKAESHRLGVRMRTEAHAATKFGLAPGWGSEGTNGKRGGGRALRVSTKTWEASFTPKYRDAVPYLAVDDIDNDEGLVRSMWIQHAGAVPLRDDAALRWLMSHPTVASPLPNLVEARRVAQTLGAMTELLVVPRYAFERVQQRARHDFAATRAKWTLQELAATLKGSLAEQHVARVFAETRRLLATRRHTTTDNLLQQRDDADIVAACDAFAARVRVLLSATPTMA